jgi:PAS domain S-box-containing protein
MPQVQYPFIDIAVHPAIRGKFAAGDAIALFSRDMAQVLWANGEGAKLFGHANIYDLIDNGPDHGGVAFRQLAATARQLETVGDRRGLMMRVSAGFSSRTIAAEVSLVEIRRGETVVIFSAPVAANADPKTRIAAMLKGFDDPDTHMAVVDDHGMVLDASPGYAALGILPETARTLVAAVARSSEGLIKRPIASAAGYLPAAIGKLSIDPPLNLVFCVETVLGRMDAPHEALEPETNNPAEAVTQVKAETPVEADDVEETPSLLGIEETETLPVEGLEETVFQDDAETKTASAEEKKAVDASEDAPVEADHAEAQPFLGGVGPIAESQTSAIEEDVAPAADQPADNLQLASDRAETSGAPDEPAMAISDDVESHQDNLELAEDEAAARSFAEFARSAEPEDHAEADMAEAALNEGESGEDVADLALIDGASAEDVEAHSTPEHADQHAMPETEAVEEPEDHVEADMAEAALLDGASAQEVEAHSIREDLDQPAMHAATDLTQEIAASPQPDHAEADRAEAALNEADTAEDLAGLGLIDGASAEDVDAHSTPEDTGQPLLHSAVELASEADAIQEPEDHVEAAAAEDASRAVGLVDSTVAETGAADRNERPERSLADEASAPDGQAIVAQTPAETAEANAEQATDVAATGIAPLEENAAAAVSDMTAESAPAPAVEAAASDQNENEIAEADIKHGTEPDGPAPDLAEPRPTATDAALLASEIPSARIPAFTFRRDGRPVRFVWKLDAAGRFSEVSDEFARTVGPHAGSINGMAYRDLDSLFHLDPSREIATLLDRRDTWSGRTIRWPVEGTDLVVPVDLAALPTYSRNREFDGFRGFGIIRVADAEKDPNAIGLTLGETGPQDMQQEAAVQAETDSTAAAPAGTAPAQHPVISEAPENTASLMDATPPAADDVHGEAPEEQVPAVSFSEPEMITVDDSHRPAEDEFRGEVPALKLESPSLSDVSEKIIQLEERRARGRDGLTQTEQNALREIARQLEPFGKRPNETLFEQQRAAAEQTPAVAEQAPAEARADETAAEASADAETTSDRPETEPQAEAFASVPAAQTPASATEAEAKVPADAANAETPEQPAADDIIAAPPPSDADVGLTASAADQIPLAILIHAGDRLIHANAEFRRFSGYDSLEALDAAGGLDALISRREGPDAGVYATRADGAQIPVAARLQSVRYEGAKLLMLTLMPAEPAKSAQDTLAEDHEAARKLASLKVEAEELRSILETATDGVVVLDMDGRIRSMNRSASALFNFENNETQGKPFAMLFAHESQKAVQDYLNGLSGHGVASVLNDGREVIGREASGGFIPLFMTMGRMPGSNSYCAVIRDITQWKRSEDELKTAKRAAETANQHKSDFLARVSHEIRTPLNAIIGFADMIASEHFGPAGHPRYVEYANDIGRSGRHVLDIVNDLLDISKIEAGEMDLEFSAVGINDCVSEAVSLVQPQANTQRVIIRTSLSQSVPDVVADLRSIKQIAINILANAIRFTPSGGQIVVSTAYEPNGSVTLRIRDTGIGMSGSELEQAMKPFGQVQPGARKRGDGTGLGLPLTRAMTEANRAIFSIQSAPNEGTLVEITFPPQRVLAD